MGWWGYSGMHKQVIRSLSPLVPPQLLLLAFSGLTPQSPSARISCSAGSGPPGEHEHTAEHFQAAHLCSFVPWANLSVFSK